MSSNGAGELEELIIRGAHAEALQAALREMLALVRRIGGFMDPIDQALVRHARAVLADSEGMP